MYPDARGSPTGWSTQTGLTLVFGSCSWLDSSTGVQAFSEAHGGRGTIRTLTKWLPGISTHHVAWYLVLQKV
jgi:hypothetical protein